MTTPHDDLDALIHAAKLTPPAPPAGAAAHGWSRLRGSVGAAVVLPQIDVPPGLVESAIAGKAGLTTTVVGWGQGLGWVGKAIASAVVTVTVGGIGAVASGIGERGASPVSQGVATPATSPNTSETAPRVATPVAEPIAAPAELPTPTPEPIVAAAIAEPAAIAKRKPDAPKPDEAPMIAAALRSLNAGDAAAALRELSRHAKVHPRGDMREERDALRVVALCKAGRTADAASARTKFLDEFPSSPHASRVQASCST